MALYIPKPFAVDDERRALELVRDYPFATLITSTVGTDEPLVTHLPLLHEDGALLGHVARTNPHWEALAGGNTLAVFHGPHAYVSPRWYVNPSDQVPTWNYATVHARVSATLLDEVGLRALIDRLTARFDPARHTDPAKVQGLLRGIVGFRLAIERLDVKFKLSQNKSDADRAGVIDGLAATGRPDDALVAEWMRRR